MVDNAWKFTIDYSTKLSGVPNETVIVDIYTLGPRVLHTQVNVTLSPCPLAIIDRGMVVQQSVLVHIRPTTA